MLRENEGAIPDLGAVLDLDPDNSDALGDGRVASSGLENDFGPDVREASAPSGRSATLTFRQPGSPKAYLKMTPKSRATFSPSLLTGRPSNCM